MTWLGLKNKVKQRDQQFCCKYTSYKAILWTQVQVEASLQENLLQTSTDFKFATKWLVLTKGISQINTGMSSLPEQTSLNRTV